MRLRSFKFALTVLIAILISQATWAEPTQSASNNLRPFKVGMILTLSGPGADYGIAIRNAVELARKDNPEKFSQINFIYENAELSPAAAITTFNKLVERDQVDLIFTWGVAFCKAIAPLAEARKIYTVGECVDEESSRGKKYFMRFMNSSRDFMETQIAALEDRKIRQIQVILSDNPYLEILSESLSRVAAARTQMVVSVERVSAAENDFRSLILKIQQRQADIVGVFLAHGQISQFYIQRRQLQATFDTFGTNYFDSQSEILVAQGTMDAAHFVSIEIKPEFIERYQKQYGNLSQIGFAAIAYEFANVIAQANAAGQTLVEFFRSERDFAGISTSEFRFVDTPEEGPHIKFKLAEKFIPAQS
ncbi:ABC transporter substrate-binding protein [bacterium]|nr:ABC transporter substrate-binding protein [bacterium]